jgi:hypothetical protein
MMNNSNDFNRKKGIFFFFILIGVLALGGLVMFLWNAILPHIFALPMISYWQALGLFVLSRILFGGFHFRKPQHSKPPFAKAAFREKFMNMTEEERQKFKQQWKERCKK